MEQRVNNVAEEFIWCERYRPHRVIDTILPDNLKKTFQQFVDQKNVPNLLLTGRAGIGKTTIAKAMLDEIGADYIVINGSNEGRKIDDFRESISAFATSVSFSGGRKYIIIDEADYLNADSVQPMLRNFMEEFSQNCGFIFTCNFKNRIIEPLHSRCSVVEFVLPKKEKPELASQFYTRVCEILKLEDVNHDAKTVAELVYRHFPDCRRVLNELQRYAATGRIDAGVLSVNNVDTIESLIKLMKTKDFTAVRKWVTDNSDIESAALYKYLYDLLPMHLGNTQSVAEMIVILAEYQYKEAFVANPEINRTAALATLMAEMVWK